MICQLERAQHCHGEDDRSATSYIKAAALRLLIIPPATRNCEFLRLSSLEGLDGLDGWMDCVRSGWLMNFFDRNMYDHHPACCYRYCKNIPYPKSR